MSLTTDQIERNCFNEIKVGDVYKYQQPKNLGEDWVDKYIIFIGETRKPHQNHPDDNKYDKVIFDVLYLDFCSDWDIAPAGISWEWWSENSETTEKCSKEESLQVLAQAKEEYLKPQAKYLRMCRKVLE